MTLKELPIGKSATLTVVGGEGALRQHFLDMGLIPGAVGNVLSQIPVLDVGIPAVLSVYFDWFSGVMQAFIFCMLTVMYIANAAEE